LEPTANGTTVLKKSAAWHRYKSAAVLTANGYKHLLPWPQRQNEKRMKLPVLTDKQKALCRWRQRSMGIQNLSRPIS
jgi:hypothetical protein